jgi:hypothetical protein
MESEGLATPGDKPQFAGRVIPVNELNKIVNSKVNDKSTEYWQ